MEKVGRVKGPHEEDMNGQNSTGLKSHAKRSFLHDAESAGASRFGELRKHDGSVGAYTSRNTVMQSCTYRTRIREWNGKAGLKQNARLGSWPTGSLLGSVTVRVMKELGLKAGFGGMGALIHALISPRCMITY